MKINRSGLALAVGLVAVGVVHGGPTQKTTVPQKLSPVQNVGLAARGTIITTLPDPKHPGKLLWKIWAKTGQLLSEKANAQGVSAWLYSAGRLDAKMTAPQADYDTNLKVIVASGGVAYTSVSHPGSSMHAPVVKWNAATGRGIASGGVLVHNGGKNGAMLKTPTAYFDSGMKTVQNYPLDGER